MIFFLKNDKISLNNQTKHGHEDFHEQIKMSIYFPGQNKHKKK